MASPVIFDTSFNTAGLQVPSFANVLVRVAPNGTAPLFAMTNMFKTGMCSNVVHGYWTKSLKFPAVTLTAGVADGLAGAFTVASTDYIVPGLLLRANTTGEIVRVISVTPPTTINVARGQGNVAAGAIANGVNLYEVGNAYEQASARPATRTNQPTLVNNNTQIFRDAWSLSNTAAKINLYAGVDNVTENRRDCMFWHAQSIEKALLFGQKSAGTLNGQSFTTMDGLESVIRQYAPGNINTALATTNYDQLETMLDPVFDFQTDFSRGSERVLFVGKQALRVINKIGRLTGTYDIVDGQTNFGLQFQTFKISRGTFRMMEHPIFNTNADWAKMAVAVDLSTLDLAYLRKTEVTDLLGRPMNNGGQGAEGGLDAQGGIMTTELTTEIKLPGANAIIYGLTAAA